MRLVATMGATTVTDKQIYVFENKAYEAEYSFLALADAFGIDDSDIVVVGTPTTKQTLSPLLQVRPSIKMIVKESDDIDSLFAESLHYIEKETILDLTQGFRHYPMLLLLSAIFSQTQNDTRIKDIFYAQTIDPNCHPSKDRCTYCFQSLYHYFDISNMARIVNTFIGTLLVLDYEVHDAHFKALKSELDKLSDLLLSNNYNKSNAVAVEIVKIIETMQQSEHLSQIDTFLERLKAEMRTIKRLGSEKESQRLLNVADYFLQKDLLLHAVTTLYESMVAFLDEEAKRDECNSVEKNGKQREATVYDRRNCLKKLFYKNRLKEIQDQEKFKTHLSNIDKLRNISAHAHTSDKTDKHLASEIRKTIRFLQKAYQNRLSEKSDIDKLKEAFS